MFRTSHIVRLSTALLEEHLGRPPKRAGERLAKNRTFRVRGELDEKLQAAAEASGRSVSEEIEHRLERSFEHQDFLGTALVAVFGDGIGRLLRNKGDDESLRNLLRQLGRSENGQYDYETYVALNTTLGFSPRSRKEWEALPPAPTSEEFENMKRRTGNVASGKQKGAKK